jgi:hypothetical protein
MGGNEISSQTGADRSFGQCNAQVRFPDAGWPQKNYIAGMVDETQRTEFPNLALNDRRLESEIKLFERLHEGKLG